MKQIFFLFFFSLIQAESLPLLFQGNKQIKETELYGALDLYKPYAYEFWKEEPAVNPKTATLLSESIKNFYRSRGFFHTSVSHDEKESGIYIIIRENSPILISDISTISQLDIISLIPFEKGEIFDPEKFEQSKKEIKLFYANAGYCNMELEAKTWIDIKRDKAYLMYEAMPKELCRFGPIKIYPPKHIDEETISSLLYIKEDEPFSPEAIRRSYQSLYGHEGISKAIINTDLHENKKASASVSVTETEKPIRFQAGLGASSDEGLMFSLGLKHRNLFKNLKTLSINTRFTQIEESIKINFDMPLANRNSTGAEIGFENEKFPGFKEERHFGTLYLKQRETPHLFQESLIFDNTITYESEDKLLFPQGELFVLSPKLEWVYDTRDNLLDPREGYFLKPKVMGSLKSDISDASYYKYRLSGAYIIPFLPSVVALKADFGSLRLYEGKVPASYRFYAGGMKSNRAYAYRKLGPVNDKGEAAGSYSIMEMTAEYRFDIYGNFRGVLFSDNTFLGNKQTPDYTQGYYSAGLGIRYLTPIGPIAIDMGFDTQDPKRQHAFHFHIGELF